MRKRCNRKVRAARGDAFTLAAHGQALLHKYDRDAFAAPLVNAIDAAAKGQASAEDWQAVCDVINVIDRFASMPTVMRGGGDYIGTIQKAVAQMLDRLKLSDEKTLRMGELGDLKGLLDLWIDILGVVTHREMFVAMDRAHEKVRTVILSMPKRDDSEAEGCA